MKLRLIDLSKNRTKGVNTIEATFMVDGELVPLRVSEEDRPAAYREIIDVLEVPNLDIDEIGYELYDLMSPVAKVKREIESSFYLSDNMSIEGGVLKFGDFVLEETLASHMLSLLNEDNTPKDEKLWKSYVTFLDNLHQNVNEDIRNQLFRWMDYENKAGHGFGITEDGCIVGYKGCQGTVLEPVSTFSGTAIVDGVEITGKIPNKVGSVISMPRSAVQYDPEVGCSVGLHVGTRDYAVNWAPILLLVKVNPRDVVSVPYECDSQKMRVCEYTVLKVTDASEEHKMYHPDPEDYDEYDDDEYFDEFDELDDDYEDGLEGFDMDLETAFDVLNEEIYIEYDDGEETFAGTVVDVYNDGANSGIIIRNDEGDYKHIKLYRISYYSVDVDLNQDENDEDEYEDNGSIDKDILENLVGRTAEITYDGRKVVKGVVTSIYDNAKAPGIIIHTEDDGVKHIKLDRINTINCSPKRSEAADDFEDFLDSLVNIIEEALDEF